MFLNLYFRIINCLGMALVVVHSPAIAAEINFSRDIQPILSDKCYFCHGPDDNNRQAGLRLDRRDDALYALQDGALIERIYHADADIVMPPPTTKLALTDTEKDSLRRWIDEGAVYTDHWAFTPLPEVVPVPNMGNDVFSRNEIDRFVIDRLNADQIQPSAPADPLRWLRRVTLDLTGLPPTIADLDQFDRQISSDGLEKAFTQSVDRLLASSAFGEHMAVAWLDSARYADSYGYQSDLLNTQWPYRDWVVRAFNNNLPYDQFLTWQLAGDLLPAPTQDQRLATAFNRLHRLNNEGGAVFEEWRIENVADRVHTFGTAMLGLTMECCRCHDHKYDPISTREYYALSAFFNSIDESGVYDHPDKIPCPSILLPTVEQTAELEAARSAVIQAQKNYDEAIAIAKSMPFQEAQFTQADMPDLQVALSFDRTYDDSFKNIYFPSEQDRKLTSALPLVPVEVVRIAALPAEIATDRAGNAGQPVPRMALHLDGDQGVTVVGIEPLDRWLAFSVVMTLRDVRATHHRNVLAHHSHGTDCGYNGWDLAITDGFLDVRLARVWPGNGISVRSTVPIPQNQWCQIAATYDGSSTAAGFKLYLDGHLLPTEVVRDNLKKQCNVVNDLGGEFVIGQRFRDHGFAGGEIDDVRVYKRALTQAELNALVSGEAQTLDRATYLSARDNAARDALDVLTQARKRFVMAEEAMHEIPVMQEMDEPRPAYVLARGQYDAKQDATTLVLRGVPLSKAIPLAPSQGEPDRLTLARWVTDPRHPLTARVAVNRVWANFFAAGLVGTAENFGLQGDLPTHPELLDWMARDFINSGWDIKRLCKSITLSATYRQDSRVTAETLAADPANKLLSRGPAYRLSAEQIRDLALTASGLANNEVGGPPVSPYQPGKDLWRESNMMSPSYKQSVGQSLYRRSLYSVWKRTAPLPNMLAFDSPTREVCTVKRSRTNTPLQALVLLNDIQFVEAARAMATEVTETGQETSVAAQISQAFRRWTGRQPSESELAILLKLHSDELQFYNTHPDHAQRLIALGDSQVANVANVANKEHMSNLAAMTVICQSILNLDATIWKR